MINKIDLTSIAFGLFASTLATDFAIKLITTVLCMSAGAVASFYIQKYLREKDENKGK